MELTVLAPIEIEEIKKEEKDYLRLVICAGKGAISDSEFAYKPDEPDWGRVSLDPSAPIPDKVITWIDLARNFASQPRTEIPEGEDANG